MSNQDIAALSHKEVGRLLAMSLSASCRMDQISGEERALLTQGNLSIDKYYAELLVLAGSAQDYAITRSLGFNGVSEKVLAGYYEVWESLAKQGAINAGLYELFLHRYTEYAEAADQEESGTISPIGLMFGGFLDSDSGHAQILALTYAPATFFSHFDGAAAVLKQAKLI